MRTFFPRRDVWLIFGLAVLVRGLAALPQAQPNYMDAAYYLAGGQRLAQGYGFNDAYVWHYLDQPTSLPHPSHLYWMPLPSILVATSQSILGVTYRAAQLPFVLLSSLLPLIAYAIAWRVSASRRHAWLAALLTIFSGFYLPYWGVPESFAPFAVFGSLALLLSSQVIKQGGGWRLVAAGMCAGLAHLSRADGVLLLIAAFANVGYALRATRPTVPLRSRAGAIVYIRYCGASLLGYMIVMTPWFMRNISVIGAPLSSAGTQAAWVCNYDELFSFNARLDFNHLIGCGIDRVMLTKLNGMASGALHLIAESGQIFLAPLIVIGLWRLRRQALFYGALLYLGMMFVAMMIVFTFAGERGGVFHSGSALLPFWYAAAPIGLDAVVGWIAARRKTWNAALARSVFSIALIGLAMALSLIVWYGRVIGSNASDPIWNQADRVYGPIGQWLRDRGEADPIVMTNNPPGFYYQTGLRSIMIPNGDVDTLLAAARQFGAEWIALDDNRPAPLAGLYADPAHDARLRLQGQYNHTYMLQVIVP